MQDIRDLDPASPAEVVQELTPCLALVAPVGMTVDDRRAWFAAAIVALKGVPIALVKRGAEEALRTADHPSKIVSTILRTIADDWAWRKRNARPAEIHGTPATALIADESRYTLDEVRALPKAVRGLGVAGGWIDPDDLAKVEAEEAAR